MSTPRKLLLLFAQGSPVPAGTALDVPRLCEALRAHGAEVETLDLDTAADALLDRLDGGAMPVVFRGDSHL